MTTITITISSFSFTIIQLIKAISFIAYVGTVIYLFYDVIHTIENKKTGIIHQNNAKILELEKKTEDLINFFPSEEETKAEIDVKKDTVKTGMDEWKQSFIIEKLDEIYSEKRDLRKESIEYWKWKIGTLITLSAMFISIAKFL